MVAHPSLREWSPAVDTADSGSPALLTLDRHLDGGGGGWLGGVMTTVALFHSVLGVRQGVLDAADRLRLDGHDVLVVDLYDGRTFDDYTPAMSFAWEEVGQQAHTSLRTWTERV